MKIILLLWASSVGKTSICNILKKNPEFKIANLDDFINKIEQENKENFKKILRETLNSIKNENILYTYMDKEDLFNYCHSCMLKISNITLELPSELDDDVLAFIREHIEKCSKINPEHISDIISEIIQLNSISETIYQQAFKKLSTENFYKRFFSETLEGIKQNETVVLDVVRDNHYTHKLIHKNLMKHVDILKQQNCISVFKVLVICSIKKLSQNIKKRNKNAKLTNDLYDARYGLFPFLQWSQTVMKKAENSEGNEKNIGYSLSYTSLFSIIKSHKKNNFVSEFTSLLNNLGFINLQSRVELVPKNTDVFAYDLTLHTDENQPEELAEILIKHIEEKDHTIKYEY